ncbi:hypothetical protein CC80DRAFT_583487 [Byssothecium circinans]|uniref:Acyclic terpene utilisation N-terminal domain-containing protein n=1 Tax=Byssothecium circinans TaxID=147558 RepID=A0A6A5TAM7_9PLEO|nr:hypothetical protein CC80DRAFT_583487 [Byssothecium circinans]
MAHKRAIRIAGNMTVRAGTKIGGQMDASEPALPYIAKYRIRVAINEGASDTRKLHELVTNMSRAKGLEPSVAWISGGEVLLQLLAAQKRGEDVFETFALGRC